MYGVSLGAAADCRGERRQHCEAVVKRVAIAVARRAIGPNQRAKAERIGVVQPGGVEPAVGCQLLHHAGYALRDPVQRQPPEERAGNGDVERVRRVGQVEIVVDDEVAELRSDTGAPAMYSSMSFSKPQ